MSKSKVGSDAVQATHDCCTVSGTGRQEQLATPEVRWVVDKKPEIELLYFDGCPTHKVVRQLVSDIFRAAGVVTALREINVTTDAQARLLKFIGSPTVRIDGRDVDPSADGAQEYGLKCRIYNIAGKLSGCPSREMIFAGLREAGYVA